MAEKELLSELHHVGIIVNDLDKSVAYYESLGFGPFKPLGLNVKERILWGKPMQVPNLKAKMGKVGAIVIELIQPDLSIDSMWARFLKTRGEGVSHIGYVAHDIDKEEAELVKRGFEVMFKARWVDGGGATYFATEEKGGTILELMTK